MFLRKNNFKLRYFILILLFLSLILMLWGRNFLSESLFFKKVLQFNLSLAKPAFSLKNQAVSFGQNIKGYFQTKKNLSDSNRLLEEGIFVQAIRPPTVPKGTARLRITIMATHTRKDLEYAFEKIRKYCVCPRLGQRAVCMASSG